MSKFRELQAANTVLLSENEELKKYISDEGHRFELKKVYYRTQLKSQKRGSNTYFQIAKEASQALEAEASCKHHAITLRAAVGK
jgi:hypothetical protein